MANIITVEEFATFRNLSKKIDVEKVQEAIDLSEKSDLYDTLGDFYFDVMKNKDALDYADLMDGSEFTFEGEVYIHSGIKAMLADFAYSRYIYMINVNLTPFGAQQKFTNDSSGIDRNTIKDLSKQAQVDAGVKFKIIQKFILSKPIIFERYCRSKSVNAGFNSQRFSKL